ncbi:MAG: class I SAM-dependent methyltransferase [Sandaracinus sp.]|nr:class I SAM-dependent methyltransferase [Sandaracinus sp.]
MRRLDVPEIEDQPWCPRVLRDAVTDHLRFLAEVTRGFEPVVPLLERALARSGTRRVVDLCSGGGGPWVGLSKRLPDVDVVLTDLYPNLEAFASVEAESRGRVRGERHPTDATDVALTGVRTLFNGFHHLPRPAAIAVLRDAVRKRQPIVIVEASDHRGIGMGVVSVAAASSFVAAPFVRPFRWERLALTWGVPAIPALLLYDGVASMLRLYGRDDYPELIAEADPSNEHTWEIGSAKVPGVPVGGLSTLLGLPR